MTTPIKELDLNKPEDCRWYIDHFELPQGKPTFVELSDGKSKRTVYFKTMTDEDAITIANQLYSMELEAEQRVKNRVMDAGGVEQ